MSSSLSAAYYADRAVQRTVTIQENVALAHDTYRVRLHCPEIARSIVPGQFVMLRLHGTQDPLLARPLALYDTTRSESGEPEGIDLVYLVKGRFTRRLFHCAAGQLLDIWGPLGNGFAPQAAQHLVMVAGGIGQTPFLALAQEALGLQHYGDPPRESPVSARVTLCYGARTAELLAGIDDFRRLGVETRLATEDGSLGYHGLVTELLEELLKEGEKSLVLVACGPEPMLRSVAQLAVATHTHCWVSLETPMACGVGICFTCVVKVRDTTGGWEYKRSCVEGPVFKAEAIEW